MAESEKSGRALSRRSLIAGGAGAATMLALGPVAKYAFGATALLRPPGGQDEDVLTAKCIKCDRCRSACPLDVISVANMNDGLINARTPKLDFHKGYCDFCNLCIEHCPTGALVAFDPESEWIGPAVIDEGLCIAYLAGGSCRLCIDGCPFDAITADSNNRPVVDLSKCNGCGYCEHICPSNTYRSYQGNSRRAIAVEYSTEARSEARRGEGDPS